MKLPSGCSVCSSIVNQLGLITSYQTHTLTYQFNCHIFIVEQIFPCEKQQHQELGFKSRQQNVNEFSNESANYKTLKQFLEDE
jgi:hypothetical protein